MARQSSSPKRKRASLPIDASLQQSTDGNEADIEEAQRPKKRGRPRKSLGAEDGVQPEPVNPKKGRRPAETAAPAAAQDKTKKKRGRPSTGSRQDEVAGAVESGERKRRGAVVAEEKPEQAEAAPRRKGREAAAAPTDEEEEQQQPTKAGRRKKPRVSFEQQEEPEQETAPAKRVRGRQSLEEANSSAPKAKQKTAPGRKTTSNKTSDPVEDAPEEAQPRGRRSSTQVALLAADAPPKPKSLPHITSRTRAIKQSTIDAKWTPLDAPSINAATETLTLAHRPIMQRMSNSQARRQHASSALSVLHRRIARKLQRGLPFPPPNAMPPARVRQGGKRKVGHEAELDFESVLDNTAALERQLDPQLAAVEVLKREKERIEKELERDYDTLRNLEAGARGEARLRRDRLRKMHVLAPEERVEKEEDDIIFDNGAGVPPGMVFKDLEDGELKDLALQLGGHIDSMRTNLRQVDGLAPQLESSGASLRGLLLRELDAEQYDRVAYGS